jgi:Protein of unknown function with PCYCGC motif
VATKKPSVKAKGKRRRGAILLIGGIALAVALVLVLSLWPAAPGNVHQAYALAPESALPANFRKAPPNVRDAYRFAIANRGILQQIPCYCGCGSDGHNNNADCYIKDVKPDGTVDFDRMSFT